MGAKPATPENLLLGLFLLFISLAPLWIPAAILIYHFATAPSIWRFSLRFLLVLIVAECVALAASVGVGDYLFR